ncbi:polysaccharide biosynthesis tyrosine autokinase [Tropicimonas sp. TH_r6]|uniref:GumC family protein n=1 Tax=Tropicimonas sp. TH_r6 TaxID=3082085 RepID=UPI002954A7B6|nr:polysaccharide biosynthesis tyrosine autokinase [Tropicimonas sp. TH_r6]MDV7142066.1 polysaccharide biosynthesis tyrosine autokinase [Tropicimonas sp. TH_r6]
MNHMRTNSDDARGTSGGPSGNYELDVLSLFRTLWYGKWLILLGILVFGFLGGYYAFVLAEERFRTAAIVEVISDEVSPINFDNLLSGSSTDSATLNTEIENIKSRELAEKVATRLNLIEDPFFNTALQEKSEFSKAVRATLSQLRGNTDGTPKTPEEVEAYQFRETVNELRKTLTVMNEFDTYLFKISATANTPIRAAEIANTLANVYIEQQLDDNATDAQQAISWLSDRARELEEEVRQKERQITELQSETDLVNRDSLDVLNLQTKKFRERLTERKGDLEQGQQRVASMEAARDSSSKAQIRETFTDFTIDRIAQPLEEDLSGDPDAKVVLMRRLETLILTEQNKVNRANDEISALSRSLESLELQLESQNADLQRLEQMQRELEVTADLYQTFLTGMQEATVQLGLVRAEARIMSAALDPLRPVSPRRLRILAASLLLGAFVASAYLLLREASQSGLRSGDELEAATGRPVLGQIPKRASRRRVQVIEYVAKRPTSAMAEAVRNLRTSIVMSREGDPPKVILTTSAVPSEGKTTVSLLLAQNYSGLGKRVLLIECDIRRNVFNEYFVNESGTGIMTVLEGKQSLQEVAAYNEKLGAYVLRGQETKANPADLFSSDAFTKLIQQAREEYDVILIDSAPVLAVPDARIIARHMDAIQLVVRWNHTPKSQVLEAIRQIEMTGNRVSGVILSQVDPRGMKRYGYGKGYGYGYADYNKYYKS